jgi:penicillin-binding protein 1C
MQLVRLMDRRPTTSVGGKLRQMLVALKLEALHSKREILEAYLSLAPYGANVEGAGAAALVYFSKSARELTLGEILALALIPQSPSSRSLARDSASEATWRERRRVLFDVWTERHPEDATQSVALDLPLPSQRVRALPFEAPHLVQLLQERHPDLREFRSSLDLRKQKFLEQQIRSYLRAKRPLGVNNAAALLADAATGEVLAYAGSADFADDSILGQVDGVQARRSPGSSLKPFVYALALEQGLIHTQTLLKDTPKSFGSFDPENFERDFKGPLSAEDALVMSRNIPAVSLAAKVASPTLYEFLRAQGLALHADPKHYGLTVALGGAELSLEQLVRLYSGLARLGAPGELAYLAGEKSEADARPWPISAESAYLTLRMLTNNPRESGASYLKWSRNPLTAAWKTGTSSGFRDAWTVGVFGPYVLGVWMGDFTGRANPALVGRELAAPLFFSIAEGQRGREKFDEQAGWNAPLQKLNVKKVAVCAVSGAFPEPACPHRKWAWMIPGRSPIAKCDIHRQVLVSRKTGRRLCSVAKPRDAELKVFEFWSSDLLSALKDVGIHKALPPDFEPGCDPADESLASGRAPEILSPRREVAYALSLSASDPRNVIPFEAISDADARGLSWFVGSEFVGRSGTREPFLWHARRGKHLVTVVDERGRSASAELEVRNVP